MRRLDTSTKIALITFCTRFHFYIDIYALYLQEQGLTLLQISTIESLVIAVQFAADVPTGIIADRIGRRWSVTLSVVPALGSGWRPAIWSTWRHSASLIADQVPSLHHFRQ